MRMYMYMCLLTGPSFVCEFVIRTAGKQTIATMKIITSLAPQRAACSAALCGPR
jgi:hypothetical protein